MPIKRHTGINWDLLQDRAGLTDQERENLRQLIDEGREPRDNMKAVGTALTKLSSQGYRMPGTSAQVLENVESLVVQMYQRGKSFDEIGRTFGLNPLEAERYFNRGAVSYSRAGFSEVGFSGPRREPFQSVRADTGELKRLVQDLEKKISAGIPRGANFDYVLSHKVRPDAMGGHALVQVYRAEPNGDYTPVGEPFRMTSYRGQVMVNQADAGGWYRSSGASTVDRLADTLLKKHLPEQGRSRFADDMGFRGGNQWQRVSGDLPHRYQPAGQEIELSGLSGLSKQEYLERKDDPNYFTYKGGSLQPQSALPQIMGRAKIGDDIYSGGGKFGKDVIKRTRLGGVQPEAMLGRRTVSGQFQELPRQQAHIYAQQARTLETSYRAKAAIFLLSDPSLPEGMGMIDPKFAPTAAESFDQRPEKWQIKIPSKVTDTEIRQALGMQGSNKPAIFRPGQRISVYAGHGGVSWGNWQKAVVTGFDIVTNDRGERVVQLRGHVEMESGGGVSFKSSGFKHYMMGGSPRQEFGLDVDIAMSSPSHPVQAMTGVLASLPRHQFEDYWRRANPGTSRSEAPPAPTRFMAGVSTARDYQREMGRYIRTWQLYVKENTDWNYVTPSRVVNEETLRLLQKANRVVGTPHRISSRKEDTPLYRVEGVRSPVLMAHVPMTARASMSQLRQGSISAEEAQIIKENFPQLYEQLHESSAHFRKPYQLVAQAHQLQSGREATGAPVLDIQELRGRSKEWDALQGKIKDYYNTMLSQWEKADQTPELKSRLAREAKEQAVSELYGGDLILKYQDQYMAAPSVTRRFSRHEDLTNRLIGDSYEKSLLGLSAMLEAAKVGEPTKFLTGAIRQARIAQSQILGTFGGRRALTGQTAREIVEHAYGAAAQLTPNEAARSDQALIRMYGLQGRRDPRLPVLHEAARRGLLLETGFRSPGVNPEAQMSDVLKTITQKMLRDRGSSMNMGIGMAPLLSEFFVMAQGGDVDEDRSRGMPLTRVLEGRVEGKDRLEGLEYHEIEMDGRLWTIVNSHSATPAAQIVEKAKIHAAGEYQSRLERLGVKEGKTPLEVAMGRVIPQMKDVRAKFSSEAIAQLSFETEQMAQVQIGQMFNTYVRQLRHLVPKELRGQVSKLGEEMYQPPLDKAPWTKGTPEADVVAFLASFNPISGTYRDSLSEGEPRILKADKEGEFWKGAAGQMVGTFRKMIMSIENDTARATRARQVAALLVPQDIPGGTISKAHELVTKALLGGSPQEIGALLNKIGGGNWAESSAGLARQIRGMGVANAVMKLEKDLIKADQEGYDIAPAKMWANVSLDASGHISNKLNLERGPGEGFEQLKKGIPDYQNIVKLMAPGAKSPDRFWWMGTSDFLEHSLYQQLGVAPGRGQPQSLVEPIGRPSVAEMPQASGPSPQSIDYMEKIVGKGEWMGNTYYRNLSAAVSNADVNAWNMLQRMVERASQFDPSLSVLPEAAEATVGALITKRTQQMVYESVLSQLTERGVKGVPRLEAGENWLKTLVEHQGEEFIARAQAPFARVRRTKEGDISGIDFFKMTTSTRDDWTSERGSFIMAKMLQEAASRGSLPFLSAAESWTKDAEGRPVPLGMKKANLAPEQIRYQEIGPDTETVELIREARKAMTNLTSMIRPGKDIFDPQSGQVLRGQGYASNQQQFIEAIWSGQNLSFAQSLLNEPGQFEMAREAAMLLKKPIDKASFRYAGRMVEAVGKPAGWKSFDSGNFEAAAQGIIAETRQKWLSLAENTLPNLLPFVSQEMSASTEPVVGYKQMEKIIRKATSEMLKTGRGKMAKMAKGGISQGPQTVMIGDNPSGVEFVVPSEKVERAPGGKLMFKPADLGRAHPNVRTQRAQEGLNPYDEASFQRMLMEGVQEWEAQGTVETPANVPLSDVPVGMAGGGGGSQKPPTTVASSQFEPTPAGGGGRRSAGDLGQFDVVNYAQPFTPKMMEQYRRLFSFERGLGPEAMSRITEQVRTGHAPRRGTQMYKMAELAGRLQPRMLGQYQRALRNVYYESLLKIQERGVTPAMEAAWRDVRGQVGAAIGGEIPEAPTSEERGQIMEAFRQSQAGKALGGTAIARQFEMLSQTTQHKGLLEYQARSMREITAPKPAELALSKEFIGMVHEAIPELAPEAGTAIPGISPEVRNRYGEVVRGPGGAALKSFLGGEHPQFSPSEFQARFGGDIEEIFGGAVAARQAYEGRRRTERLSMPEKRGVWEGSEQWLRQSPLFALGQLSRLTGTAELAGQGREQAIKELRSRSRLEKALGQERMAGADVVITREGRQIGAQLSEQQAMMPHTAFAVAAELRQGSAQGTAMFQRWASLEQERSAALAPGGAGKGKANQLAQEMNELASNIKEWNDQVVALKPTVQAHAEILKEQTAFYKEELGVTKKQISATQQAMSGIEARLADIQGPGETADQTAARRAQRRGLGREYNVLRRQMAGLRTEEQELLGEVGIREGMAEGLETGRPIRTPRQMRMERTPGLAAREWFDRTFSAQNLFYGLQNVQQMQYMFQAPLEERRQQYLSSEFQRGQMLAALGGGGVTPDIRRYQAESAAMTNFAIAFGRGVNQASPRGLIARWAMQQEGGEDIVSGLGAASQWATTGLQGLIGAHMLGFRPHMLGTAGRAIGRAIPGMLGVGTAASTLGKFTAAGAGLGLGVEAYNLIRPEGAPEGWQTLGQAAQLPFLGIMRGAQQAGLISPEIAATGRTGLGGVFQNMRTRFAEAFGPWGFGIGQPRSTGGGGGGGARDAILQQPAPGEAMMERLRGIQFEGTPRLAEPQIASLMRAFGESTGVTARELDTNVEGVSDLLYKITNKLLEQGLDPGQIDAAVEDYIAKAPQLAGFMAGSRQTLGAIRYAGEFENMLDLQNRLQSLQAVSGVAQFAGMGIDAMPGMAQAYSQMAQNQGLFAAQRQLSAMTGGTSYDFSDLARRSGQGQMAMYDPSGRPRYQQQIWDIEDRQSAYDLRQMQDRGRVELDWMDRRMGLEQDFWDFRMASREKDFALGQRSMDLSIRQMELNLKQADRQFELQEKFEPRRFEIQRQMFDLQTGWQRQEFGIQRQRMQTRYGWQMEDFDRQETRQGVQRQWQLEDFATNRSTFELQQGWQAEDFQRALRFASGRERMDIMRQRERAGIMANVQRERFDTQERRAGIEFGWQREDLGVARGRAAQTQGWNVEDLNRAVEQFETLRPLQRELIDLNEQYWSANLERQREFNAEQRAIQVEQIQLMKDRQAATVENFGQETILMEAQRAFDVEQDATRRRWAEEDLNESVRRATERQQVTEWQRELTLAQQAYAMIQQQGWDYAAQRSQEVLAIQKQMTVEAQAWAGVMDSRASAPQGASSPISGPMPTGGQMPYLPVITKDTGGLITKPTMAMLSANSQPEYVVPAQGALVLRGGEGGKEQIALLQAILDGILKLADGQKAGGGAGQSTQYVLGKMFEGSYRVE